MLFRSAVQAELTDEPVFRSANTIGGKVAGNTKITAVVALEASLVLIVLYVWVRFQNVAFGLAAVVALAHDVLVAVACLAVSRFVAPFLGWALVDDFKISLDVVAALLTIVGFSLHDTIIVFICVVTVTVVHEVVVNSVRSLPIVLCGVGVVVAFAVLHLASPGSLGWGDVLLVAPLTLAVATVSPSRVVPWLLAASCMAAAHGLVMRVRRGERFVAFGPHLLAAAWLMQVVGV